MECENEVRIVHFKENDDVADLAFKVRKSGVPFEIVKVALVHLFNIEEIRIGKKMIGHHTRNLVNDLLKKHNKLNIKVCDSLL